MLRLNKKGFAALVISVSFLIILGVTLVVVFEIFDHYVGLSQAQLNHAQNYYYAEFGILYLKWLTDERVTAVYTSWFTIPESGDMWGVLGASYNNESKTYTFSSTVTRDQNELLRTITATYKDGRFTSWS